MKTLRATTQTELDKVLSENSDSEFNLDLRHFKTDGDLVLNVLKLKGYLDLSHAEIEGCLDIEYIEIRGNLYLNNAKIEGNLSLNNAKIGGYLNVRNTKIRGYLDLRNTKIGGSPYLYDAKIEGNLYLNNVKIKGNFEIKCAKICGDIISNYTQKDIDFLKSLPLQIIDLKTWQSNKNWLEAKTMEDLHNCGTTYCVRGYAEAQYYVENGEKIKDPTTLYPNLKHLFHMTNKQFMKEREYIINL